MPLEKEGLSHELSKESEVDLSSLSVDFCSNQEIEQRCQNKLKDIQDKDQWLEKNREKIAKNKSQIQKALEKGLISDDKSETLWEFEAKRLNEIKEKAPLVKQEIEQGIENIKEEVKSRLQKFIPSWKLKEASVTFTMNDRADFWVVGHKITVDLGRLALQDQPLENTIQGLTHELFHVWNKEGIKDEVNKEKSVEEIKNNAKSDTVNEGLAVLIGEQSLSKHHEEMGRDYNQYIIESFDSFNKILSQANVNAKEFRKLVNKEFRDMGHFYVVGYEIANQILQKMGINKLREIIKDIRENPKLLFQEYKQLCQGDKSLPKINI